MSMSETEKKKTQQQQAKHIHAPYSCAVNTGDCFHCAFLPVNTIYKPLPKQLMEAHTHKEQSTWCDNLWATLAQIFKK